MGLSIEDVRRIKDKIEAGEVHPSEFVRIRARLGAHLGYRGWIAERDVHEALDLMRLITRKLESTGGIQ